MKQKLQRIKPPKYRVGRFLLNEYELRALMVDVAQGRVEAGVVVKDQHGNKTTIREDGRLVGSLYGLDIMGNLTLDLIPSTPEPLPYTPIDAPYYYLNGYRLNEYEVRKLILDVFEGKREPGVVVHGQNGTYAIIGKDGIEQGSLYGMDICSRFTLEMIRIRRERRAKNDHNGTTGNR